MYSYWVTPTFCYIVDDVRDPGAREKGKKEKGRLSSRAVVGRTAIARHVSGDNIPPRRKRRGRRKTCVGVSSRIARMGCASWVSALLIGSCLGSAWKGRGGGKKKNGFPTGRPVSPFLQGFGAVHPVASPSRT